jgi:predicted transcriptional regulator
MERLSNLFFELSHEDRLEILSMLMDSPIKLTKIAYEMDISSQEVYRHLSRLVDSGLVSKTPEGDYKITSYGSQTMKLVPGYDFLTKHSAYFMNRDTSLIPDGFMARVGELSKAKLVNDVMVAFLDVEVMLREAEEYACLMSNQMIMSLYRPIIEASDRGIILKVMRPRGWRVTEETVEKIGKQTFIEIRDRIIQGKIIQKEPEVIPVFMAYSERQVAALSFPNLAGELDYLGFKTDDEKACNWSHELFDYIWDRAHPGEIRTIID